MDGQSQQVVIEGKAVLQVPYTNGGPGKGLETLLSAYDGVVFRFSIEVPSRQERVTIRFWKTNVYRPPTIPQL